MIIKIVAVGALPEGLLDKLVPRLMESFALLVDDCVVNGTIEMPPTAYDALREQHNADVLLDHVRREMPGNDKVLALTYADIFSQGKNFLFGQAQCPGNAAIVSICRLNPTFYGMPANHELLVERTTKEAVHELAHNFGLDHCDNLKCVMSFSNSSYEADRKTSTFCEVCRKKLYK